MPSRRDAGGAVHVKATVVIAGEMRLARVQAHPHRKRAVHRPVIPLDGELGGHRGPGRRAGLGERREEGVAFGPDDDAPVRFDRRADDPEMRGIDVVPGRPELPNQAHRSLHVGAQECHGPGRQSTVARALRPGTVVVRSLDDRHCALIRSASVASIAIAASGRSRRIDFSAAPLMSNPCTGPSAVTVAARGRSRRTASSPMCSPAA